MVLFHANALLEHSNFYAIFKLDQHLIAILNISVLMIHSKCVLLRKLKSVLAMEIGAQITPKQLLILLKQLWSNVSY